LKLVAVFFLDRRENIIDDIMAMQTALHPEKHRMHDGLLALLG
jgi:hypothetical protein